jgi:hypothetical protein
MESLLVAVLVAVLVWLVMRHASIVRMRRLQARKTQPDEHARTMPRIGTPGTVTPAQLQRLKQYHFEAARWWSREEADLILDAVDYLRAAIAEVTGEQDAPEEVQNQLLTFMLSDEALRQYLVSWGNNRRNKGERGKPSRLARNEHYERVAGFIRSLGGSH